MKKKRKHWTTKNTHLKRMKCREFDSPLPMTRFEKKCEKVMKWITILIIIAFIILVAFGKQAVGYDHFPSIPIEWIKWLK